jgi:ATP-dependent helicase/nuclease subunit A
MNLHQAKGLQAPVVFLADPSGQSDHAVKLHVDRRQERVRGYFALYGEANAFGRAPLLAHPSDWETLASREAKFLDAENNRLLYVAVTRARDQLVITLRGKPSEANPWQPLAISLTESLELPDPGSQSPPKIEATRIDAGEVVLARKAIAARWQSIVAPTYASRAAKQVTFSNAPQAARIDSEGSAPSERGERWGAVIHLLLQSVMRMSESNLDTLATSVLRAADLDVELSGEAVEAVQRVTNSKLWRRARSARRTMTEVPFVVSLPSEATLVRGVIDLAFEEHDGWVLVDYKTDRATVPRVDKLKEIYRSQLTTYRDAWMQFATEPVKELGLYFTSVDRYVTVGL